MTLGQHPEWCKTCGQAPCLCRICHGAGLLRGPGPMGSTVPCICHHRVSSEPMAPPVRQPRRIYADRLDS